MASGPDLRIGDAERDVTTRQLRECFAQGRLTMDEFNDRLGQALAATTQSELDRLTQDLPPPGLPPRHCRTLRATAATRATRTTRAGTTAAGRAPAPAAAAGCGPA